MVKAAARERTQERMDPRLLDYYNSELQYIRARALEFAEQHPKIADPRLDDPSYGRVTIGWVRSADLVDPFPTNA
jgi:hypothetical protein